MNDRRRTTTGPLHAPDVFARLHVLWIVSSLLLLVLVILVAVVAQVQLRRQGEALAAQQAEINALRERLAETGPVAGTRAPAAPGGAPSSPSTDDSAATPVATRPATTQAIADQAVLAARLDGVLEQRGGRFSLTDGSAALDLVRAAAGLPPEAALDRRVAERLAITALLLNRPDVAEQLAGRISDGVPEQYLVLAGWAALERGDLAGARSRAAALEQGGRRSRAAALRGAIELRQNARAAALRDLRELAGAGLGRLSAFELLHVADAAVALERWGLLERVLEVLHPGTTEQRRAGEFYRAILAVQGGDTAGALALLDNLLEEADPEPEILMWRAVALLEAGQTASAREALAHIGQSDRADVWYWRGMIEIEAGNADRGREALRQAVTFDEAFAPAWEALGALALQAGDPNEARAHMTRAVSADPQRAPAQFMLAIVCARQEDAGAAGRALRAALLSDPSLLESALQTDVLTSMFDSLEMQRWASEPAAPGDPPPVVGGDESP